MSLSFRARSTKKRSARKSVLTQRWAGQGECEWDGGERTDRDHARRTNGSPEDIHNAMESQNSFRAESGSGDADCTIISGFAARREHGLPTWCCCIDFVNAFDTAPKELLWIILAKFDAPPKLVRLLRILHAEDKVIFEVGESRKVLCNSIGVL